MAWIATLASALIGAGSASASSSKAGAASAASDLAMKQKGGAAPYQPTANQFTRPDQPLENTARSLSDYPRQLPQPTNTFGGAMQQHPGISAPQPAAAPQPGANAPPPGGTTAPATQPQGVDWGKYAQMGIGLASQAAQPAPAAPLNRPAPAAPYEPTATRLSEYGRRAKYPTF